MNAPRAMLAAVLALCVLVAGCGSDDGGSPAQADAPPVTTSSLSKEEFIQRAGAVCDRARQTALPELSTYAEKHKGVPREELLADAFKAVLVPMVEQEMAAIRKLGAPPGDEEEIEAILAAQQEGIDRVKRIEKARSGSEFPAYFEAADEMLLDYGLTGCSRDIS